MPMLGILEKPVAVDDALVGQCETLLDAILLCVHLSRFSHTFIRAKVGIDKGHWARILQGNAHFPTNKMNELMQLCRNLAPLQWLSAAAGVPLMIDRTEQRKAELRRELALLEAQGPSTGVNVERVAA